MYTECPNCHTFFKVTSAHLKVAEGRVRCGTCNKVFNALAALTDTVPASALARRKKTPVPVVGGADVEAIGEEVSLEGGKTSVIENEVSEVAESSNTVTSFSQLQSPTNSAETSFETDMANSGVADFAFEAAVNKLDEDTNNSSVFAIPPFSEVVKNNGSGEASSLGEASGLGDLSLSSAVFERDERSENNSIFAGSTGEAFDNNLSGINQEIDNALDGLFDEDISAVVDKSAQAPMQRQDDLSLSHSPEVGDFSSLSGLDLSDDLNASFSGLENFTDELEQDYNPASASKNRNNNQKDQLDELNLSGFDDFDLDSAALGMQDSEQNVKPNVAPTSPRYSADNFVLRELDDDSGSGSGLSKMIWLSLIFLLLVILMGQFIYLKREALVKYPQIIPILELECKMLGLIMPCDVPSRKAPDMISMSERNVVSHPSADNALLINSVIKNAADFTQEFPLMVLTFSDINHKVMAERTFTPEEYLAKDVALESGMAPEIPFEIKLEIEDPGESAVNFEFKFK